MPIVEVDCSEAQDPISPGVYHAIIKEAKPGMWPAKDSSRKDIHYLNWRLETFGESEAKNNGRSIFHKTSINGKVIRPLKDLFSAATGEKAPEGQTNFKFNSDQLIGRKVTLTVVPSKDPQYTEVKTVTAYTGN